MQSWQTYFPQKEVFAGSSPARRIDFGSRDATWQTWLSQKQSLVGSTPTASIGRVLLNQAEAAGLNPAMVRVRVSPRALGE